MHTTPFPKPMIAAELPRADVEIHQDFRPILVPMFAVESHLGITAERALDLVDCGELRWVFDVSVGQGRCRDLRFWLTELLAQERVRECEPAHVIERVVGHSLATELRAVTVSRTLYVSRATVLRLVRSDQVEGRLAAHTLWIERASLMSFLSRRLVS